LGSTFSPLKENKFKTFIKNIFGNKRMANKETEKKDETINNEEKNATETTNAAEKATDEKENADAQPELSTEEKLKNEVAELNDKYLRLYSEFENMRRRNAKERMELTQTAGKDILIALLPVIDDFERALKALEGDENKTQREGVELIHNKFLNILTQKGLTPMDAMGKEFDPEIHEAVTKIPAPEKKLKGKVVDVIEKGYTLQEKVIRYAKVVVGE
jgi:molecular chaperone GrpE